MNQSTRQMQTSWANISLQAHVLISHDQLHLTISLGSIKLALYFVCLRCTCNCFLNLTIELEIIHVMITRCILPC